ncbi:MAG: hypothetical protein KIG68_09450 [Oxalobacter sp.]|nr:hypothetical protein [Oxalobacter sp.]
MRKIAEHTGRNVMLYYSGWLQKPTLSGYEINDSDKNGFMACCPKKVDREKGLDLILHTPGGDVAATESIIDYLYELYKGDIRAFIPQLAMSGGTLIATSCKEIVMGHQSSIGPIDPQINGIAAQSYIAEFERANLEIAGDANKFLLWQQIIGQMKPGTLTMCQKAIEWSNDILSDALKRVMFANYDEDTQEAKIESVRLLLGDQNVSKAHNRHIPRKQAQDAGLVVTALEDDNELQDLILTVHHLMGFTFQQSPAIKIFANDQGAAYIVNINQPFQM